MAGEQENVSLDISMLDDAILSNLETVEKTPEVPTETKVEEKKEETTKVEGPITTKEDMEKVIEVLDKFEEKEEASTEEVQEKGKPNAEDPPATSVYSALAGLLKERGVIPSLEDASIIKDDEDLVKAFREELERSKYAGLSDKQLSYMKAIEAGVDEELTKSVLDVVENIGSITDKEIQENKDLRENLIREDLKALGWDDKRITKQIERLVQAGDDIDEAYHSRSNIVTKNKERLDQEAATKLKAQEDLVKQQEAQLQALKDQVYNADKVLDTVKADEALKNKVYEAMTTATEYTEEGTPINALVADRLKDPVDFEKRLYYTWVLTNGFKDIKNLQRKAESTAARKLREAMSNANVELTGSGGAGLFKPDATGMPDIVDVAD